MIVMGVDASTNCTGWSIFFNDELLAYGKIVPKRKHEDWRERIVDIFTQLDEVIKQYHPDRLVVEDVPLFSQKGKKTLIQLGAVQGSLLLFKKDYPDLMIDFIPVSTWRKNIGIFSGDRADQKRDKLKENSIKLANQMFNLNLIFVSPGSSKNDDDISDSILIAASTMKKYRVSGNLKKK